MFLRENHQIALYVACGDITDVSLEGDVMRVLVEDSTMLSVLNGGRREIERALSWQGLELKLEIKQKIIPPTKEEEDIKTLKNIFGEKLTIKGE